MALTEIPSELSSTPSIVDGGNATAITIDSSKNVLVGTTTTNIATEGTVIYGSGNEGVMTLSSTAMTALYVNRSNDGELVQFRQGGGNIVGSIGTASGYLAAGSTNLGLYYNGATTEIYPVNTATTGNLDGTTNLGRTTARWKDLYLSGGAYLGGTAAANKLDDYEESTFTATLRGSTTNASTLVTTTGYVTKIGRIVHYVISFENINTTGYSGAIYVTGLPYANTGGRHIGNSVPYLGGSWSGDVFGLIENTATDLRIMSISSASTWTTANHNASNGVYLWFSGTYITNA